MTEEGPWPRPALRRICSMRYGDSLAADDRVDGPVLVYGSNGTIGTHDVANTSAPVIVLGRKGSSGKLHYSSVPVFAIDTTFVIDRRTTRCHLRWLYHALSTLRLDEITSDVGVPGLSRDSAYAQPIMCPSLQAQQAVADFLDAETARIDRLIAMKRELDTIAEERLQGAVRAAAAGWPNVSLRRLWKIIDCRHRTPAYVEEGFPVVSPGDVSPGRLDLRRCHRFVDATDFADLSSGHRHPRSGDIVYSRNASIGIAAYVNTDQAFTMGQDVCLIRSDAQDQLWLTFMLNSVGIDQLQSIKIGSTFDRVNIGQMLDLQIPLPPFEVQKSLAEALDGERRRIDRLHGTLLRQIAFLQERRQTLVTAAVTGQLDIPGAFAA